MTAAFGTIKVRVSGLVFCGDELALLRRVRGERVLHSTVGGNVEPGEDLREALWRELEEEIGLRREQVGGAEPQLVWLQDARVDRPGPTPAPRKLHLHYRLSITSDVRATLAAEECDTLPDGTRDVGTVEWIHYRDAARLHLFPPIGPALAELVGPTAPVPRFDLEPVTERTYRWL